MNLRLPGPIPVSDDILEAMSGAMINHRGPRFKEILYRITNRLKQVFETNGDVYVLTASGTGAMEATVVNTLSPGDKVLCASVGSFGARFGEIARRFGAEVVMLDFPFGSAVDPDELRKALQADASFKAVLVTHNETSTGVTNDLEAITAVAKGEFEKLILVDGVSSVCSLPLKTDEWGCDVVATASQKGWMLPPGLAFMSFSERAWQAHEEATMPRYYFDISEYKRYFEIGQPPYTPAISVFFALDLALQKIVDEGLSRIIERHAEIARMARDGVRALGLSLFPDERVASDTVTAVRAPDGVEVSELLALLREEYQVELASGQESLKDEIFRIGHMGYVTPADIQEVINALTAVLPRLGFDVSAA